MEKLMIKIKSVEEMQKLAYDLTMAATPSTVIALNGDLGAGKTTFTKGVGLALGIKRIINSPTFTIMKTYDVTNNHHHIKTLYHLDVYRLNDSHEDFELEEYFYQDGLTIIEWAHIIQDLLPNNTWYIDIYRLDDTTRKLVLTNMPTNVLKAVEEKYEIIY